MKHTYGHLKAFLYNIILLIIMLGVIAPAYGQGWNFKDLTRGKLWARIWNSTAVGQPTLYGQDYYKYDYPGHEL